MKPRFTHSLVPALLLAAPLAHGQWLAVADPDDYSLGINDPLLNAGWIFQDGDYYAYPACQDGTNDCTGYRAVVESPYNPSEGAAKSILMRAGDPDETLVANSRHNLAITLPQEIPVDGDATLFVHFAIEEQVGVRWFTLSDQIYEPTGPIVEAGDPLPNHWADTGPLFSIDEQFRFRVYETIGGGYVNAIEDAGDPQANIAESQVWYSLWMHINNDAKPSSADIGGHFDLYIAGGKFGDTPVHIVNSVPVMQENNLTAWTFRDNASQSLKSFVIIGQYGDPANSTLGFGGTYVNAVYLTLGEHTLETPWGDAPPSFADVINAIDIGEGWNTSWFGEFYEDDNLSGWVYHEGFGWIYTGNVEAVGSGFWFYSNSQAQWSYTGEGIFPVLYFEGHEWVFYQIDRETGAWIWDYSEEQWLQIP